MWYLFEIRCCHVGMFPHVPAFSRGVVVARDAREAITCYLSKSLGLKGWKLEKYRPDYYARKISLAKFPLKWEPYVQGVY